MLSTVLSEDLPGMSVTNQVETQQLGMADWISTGDHITVMSTVQEPTTSLTSDSVAMSLTSPVKLSTAGDDLCPPTRVIQQTLEKLNVTLPPLWVPIGDKIGVHLYRLSTKVPTRAIQREVFIPYSGGEQIFVHCEPLPSADKLLQHVEATKVILTENTVDLFCTRGVDIARILEQYTVCVGADLLDLKHVWGHISNSSIDNNPYQEDRYTETCRSNSCSRLIVLGKGKRCKNCTKLLRSMKRRRKTILSEIPHPNTSNIHLTYKQALAKLKLKHDDIKSEDLKIIAYLERQFIDILNKEGVDLDENLSEDLANILANSKLTTEQEIFFRGQFACSGRADQRVQRWHPYMIRLALHLHVVSHSAFEDLRETGVMKLPNSQPLYDYSQAFVPEEGISDQILGVAKAKIDTCKKNHEKYVSVHANVVTVSKDLVYRQSDKRLLGFSYLDEVGEEVLQLEKLLSGQEESSKGELASKMLALMIKGCTSDVTYVVASFPCNQLSKDVLYTKTWNLISRLENAGIKVLVVVAEGCAVSRAFVDMHEPHTVTESGIIFDTLNSCSGDKRPLYFISDVANLLKTIRNCFYNSGEDEKKTRCLEINGEKIVWRTMIRLYMTLKRCAMRKSNKLNSQNVFINSHSCKKVRFAADVLSETVALDLEQQNWPSTKETIRFIRNCSKVFDILNGVYTTQHTQNKDLAPFSDISDSRFEWLQEFLNYLKEWEYHVKSQNLPPEEQDRKLLSRQTREGIEICIRGFTAATKFLLREGADFVTARTFSQDHLEQNLSVERPGGGGSSNFNASQFLSKQVSVNIKKDLGVKKSDNVKGGDEKVDLSNEPLTKKPRK